METDDVLKPFAAVFGRMAFEAGQQTDRSTATGGTERGGRADEEAKRATRVVLSYPADLSDWGRFQVEKPSFRAFLRNTREQAHEGDIWEEFVGVGCCGNTLDVPLCVEQVVGGSHVDAETEIDYDVRDACGIEGSWRVQSAGGPSRA